MIKTLWRLGLLMIQMTIILGALAVLALVALVLASIVLLAIVS